MRLCGAVLLTAVALTGCGGGADGAECVALDDAGLSSIAEGLRDGGELSSGHAVKLADPEMGMEYVAAVEGPGGVALFGMGDADGGGPIMAASEVAQERYTWGEATTDGSPADTARDNVLAADEAEDAIDCLDES